MKREKLTAIIIAIIALGYTCYVERCTYDLTDFSFIQRITMFGVYSYISILFGCNFFYALKYIRSKSKNTYIKYIVKYCVFKGIEEMLLEIAIAITIGLLNIKNNNVEVSYKLVAGMIIYELIVIGFIIGAHLKANDNWKKYVGED